MSSIDIFKYYKDDPSEFIKQKYNQDQNAQERHLSNLLSHSIRISKEHYCYLVNFKGANLRNFLEIIGISLNVAVI